MSHPKFYERTYFHARSHNELEAGRTSPTRRTGHEHRDAHQMGLMPKYDDLDRGYGVRQSRGSRRPGGYGWKPEGHEQFIDSEVIGTKKGRFNGIQQPVHLISSPHTATHDPSEDHGDVFVAMPQNMLNARNTRQLAFTTQRSVWDQTYGSRPSTTPTLKPVTMHPGMRPGESIYGMGGRPVGPYPPKGQKK